MRGPEPRTEFDAVADAATDRLRAQAEHAFRVPASAVDPERIRLRRVREHRVKIAVAVDVGESHVERLCAVQRVRRIEAELARAVVEPDLAAARAVCDECVEVAVAVEIAEGDGFANRRTERLAAVPVT